MSEDQSTFKSARVHSGQNYSHLSPGLDLTSDEIEDLVDAEATSSRVSYSTNDFDVEGLVTRLQRGDVIIPRIGERNLGIETEEFQRGFVWNKKQMDRFIESLLLEFPIPSFFFVKQKDKKYLVLDGQQRLETLRAFYEGYFDVLNKDGALEKQEFSLSNVALAFKSLSYKTLSESQKRTLDSTFLTSVIVTTDDTLESQENIYKIFERLNSGGTSLTAHEIRVALFSGEFIKSLDQLSQFPAWQSLYGKRNPRLRDQELILRILAFYLDYEEYKSPLKSFLNEFAGKYRNYNLVTPQGAEALKLEEAVSAFRQSAELLNIAIGSSALRRGTGGGVNSAQTEAIFVGLMRRLRIGEIDIPAIQSSFERIMSSQEFLNSTDTGTSAAGSVKNRFDASIKEFSGA